VASIAPAASFAAPFSATLGREGLAPAVRAWLTTGSTDDLYAMFSSLSDGELEAIAFAAGVVGQDRFLSRGGVL